MSFRHALFFVLTPFFVWAEPQPSPGPRTGRVLVVANSSDPVSLELAWEYMRARHLPAANLVRIPFANPINIDAGEFQKRLVEPVERRLEELPAAVDFIVLMRGVPYRVGKFSTSTALFFRGVDSIRPLHEYYQREFPFDGAIPLGGVRRQLVTFLTGYTYEETHRLIQRSLARHPSPGIGTFYLCEGEGPRGSRKPQIDGALLALQRVGARGERVVGANLDKRLDVLGQFTGAPRLSLAGNRYLAGSIVDNMTSFGGFLFDPHNQMSILSFIQHGACGAYGTVSEPTNSWARWADFSLPARYAIGFTLAESYYQTVRDFSFGLVVGDPLMAPFAKPATLELAPQAETVAAGEATQVRISVREGTPGEGVGPVDVWLDDMTLAHRWYPVLPPGVTCGLRLRIGDEVVAEKIVEIAGQGEDLGTVLDGFTGTIGQVGRILRGGRRGEKLLLFMIPATDGEGNLAPAAIDFTIEKDGVATVASAATAAQPLFAHCAVVDLGAEPPQPGDRVSFTVGRQTRSAQAFSTDSLADLADKLVRVMVNLPPLQEDGPFSVQIRQVPVEPPRYQIVVIPKNIRARQTFPLKVEVTRTAGSTFARELAGVRNFWQDMAVGGLAEAVLTPRLPIAEATFSVPLPGASLRPGPHRITAVTVTPSGCETVAETQFVVKPPPGGDFSARFSGDTFDLDDSLTIYLQPGDGLATAFPKLVVNGMVVGAWPPGTPVGEFPLRPSLVAPGRHEVWIEWDATDGVPHVSETRSPLARSTSHRLFVRRPLATGVTLSPATVEAGTQSVHLSGPYLGERIRIATEREPLHLTRDERNPMIWHLAVGRLHPGEYALSIGGDATTDRSQLIPTTLTITYRQPKTD